MNFLARIFLLCASILLGFAACVQALSNIYAKDHPLLAARLSPLASAPLERMSVKALQLDENGRIRPTAEARQLAARAHRISPLSTEALAILALTQPTAEKQSDTIQAIQQLSRRGRLLGAVALQSSVDRRSAPEAIVALDRILRVYPSLTERMMTTLLGYVSDDSVLPSFRQVLRLEPQWRNAFFGTPPPNPEGLRNMARLRQSLGADYPLLDDVETRLVGRLIAVDMWDEALALREMAVGHAAPQADKIAWTDEDPVFDWLLADESGFYARPDGNSGQLRIRVRPGQGGRLAAKLLRLPENRLYLNYRHSLEPVENLDRFTLTLECAKSGEKIAETTLKERAGRLPLAEASCDWVYVILEGRVWSTGREVEGRLTSLSFGTGGAGRD